VTGSTSLTQSFAEPTLPRSNGEITFDQPWQARALAIAVLSVDRSGCTWDDFRHLLIGSIADAPNRAYWESWLVALEAFVEKIVLRDVTP